MKLDLKNIDRTRAFTEKEQEVVNKLPYQEHMRAMSRPNSMATMSREDREKHYQSKNFPTVKYHSANGGGAGTITPPKKKG